MFLPAGQGDATFPHDRVIAPGKVCDVTSKARHAGSPAHPPFIDRRQGKSDVILNAGGKEERVLRHEANPAAQGSERNQADVLTVDGD